VPINQSIIIMSKHGGLCVDVEPRTCWTTHDLPALASASRARSAELIAAACKSVAFFSATASSEAEAFDRAHSAATSSPSPMELPNQSCPSHARDRCRRRTRIASPRDQRHLIAPPPDETPE
jgi:hypothetical protein